jgi:hypothetical protein
MISNYAIMAAKKPVRRQWAHFLFMIGSWATRLADAAAAFQAGDHHAGHGRFQNALGLSQGVIQRGAFLEFLFVQRVFLRQ